MADPVEELLKGNIQTVEYSNGNVIVNAPRGGKVYMAGSFNPLHEGHRGMLAAALTARQDKQGLERQLLHSTCHVSDAGAITS